MKVSMTSHQSYSNFSESINKKKLSLALSLAVPGEVMLGHSGEVNSAVQSQIKTGVKFEAISEAVI